MKNIDDPPASTPAPTAPLGARLANDTSPPSDEKRRAERRRCFSNTGGPSASGDEPALPPASAEERDADTSVARVFVPTFEPEGGRAADVAGTLGATDSAGNPQGFPAHEPPPLEAPAVASAHGSHPDPLALPHEAEENIVLAIADHATLLVAGTLPAHFVVRRVAGVPSSPGWVKRFPATLK